MIFWDASALFPLIIRENSTPTLLELLEKTDTIFAWTLTPIEIFSALCRIQREKYLKTDDFQKAWARWKEFSEFISFINNVEVVKTRAERILQTHPLKAADALQLAAALIACSDDSTHHLFVTLDTKLVEAARKEGFEVRP